MLDSKMSGAALKKVSARLSDREETGKSGVLDPKRTLLRSDDNSFSYVWLSRSLAGVPVNQLFSSSP